MDPVRENPEALEVHLRDYLWVIRKHLGVALTFFIVVVAAVAVVTFKARPVYRASAEIYMEKVNPSLISVRELYDLGSSPDEYRKTQHELIQSRQLAKAVFDRNRLADHPDFRDHTDPVEAFRERITVSPKEGTYLATVSLDAGSPEQAADWVNDLLDEYIRYVDLQRKTTSSEVKRSLTQEIPRLSKKLLESESRLIEFQRQDNVLSFEKQQEILFRKLQDLDTALTKVQRETVSLESRMVTLSSLSGGSGNGGPALLPEDLETPLLRSLRMREVSLLEAFVETQARYRPRTPQYEEAKEKLSRLRDEITNETGRVRKMMGETLFAKRDEVSRLEGLISTQKKAIRSLDDKSNQYAALKAEVESNRRMYYEFLERRKEVESTSGFGATNISIVDRAIPPRAPISPKKWLNLTLAVIVGLLGGVALAFFFEYLDDTIKTPEEVKDVLGLPFLGLIPVIPRTEIEKRRGLVTGESSFSSVAEGFRSVRTGLHFTGSIGSGRSVAFMITSPGPREGKTLNSVNLAITVAQSDLRVCLVDGDLRKPNVHNMLDLENDKGLSTLCTAGVSLEDVIQETGTPNLAVIPSGPIPPNPSELLGSERMGSVLEELKSRFDFVLIDTPPAGLVTDPVVLASRVDGVILVISTGATRRKAALQCLEQISRVHGKILGAVLNSFKILRGSYYRYAYYRTPYYRRETEAVEDDREE